MERLKERKRTKKKETEGMGGLVEPAAAEQINQGGLRQYFLGDLLRCLENPAGFPTVTHKPGGGD
ncbi:MAG TPA: hypothetical protein VER98_06835 [Terriglobia bacterium]|nr:hypothetical protein [Terriglobia bacterium]